MLADLLTKALDATRVAALRGLMRVGKACKDVQSRGDGRMLKYIKWKRIERRMEKKKEEHGMEGMCEAHKNGEG